MANIETLTMVCDIIEKELQAIYENKADYSVDNTPYFLTRENYAAYNALYLLKLNLEKKRVVYNEEIGDV
jgi:hypothetical protein